MLISVFRIIQQRTRRIIKTSKKRCLEIYKYKGEICVLKQQIRNNDVAMQNLAGSQKSRATIHLRCLLLLQLKTAQCYKRLKRFRIACKYNAMQAAFSIPATWCKYKDPAQCCRVFVFKAELVKAYGYYNLSSVP